MALIAEIKTDGAAGNKFVIRALPSDHQSGPTAGRIGRECVCRGVGSGERRGARSSRELAWAGWRGQERRLVGAPVSQCPAPLDRHQPTGRRRGAESGRAAPADPLRAVPASSRPPPNVGWVPLLELPLSPPLLAKC